MCSYFAAVLWALVGHYDALYSTHQGEDNQQDNAADNRQGLCIHLYLLFPAIVAPWNKYGYMPLVILVLIAEFCHHLTLFFACEQRISEYYNRECC